MERSARARKWHNEKKAVPQCSECKGTGEVAGKKCPECGGHGYETSSSKKD